MSAVKSKILPSECFYKDGKPLSDIEIVEKLIKLMVASDAEKLRLAGIINEMEQYILNKYGDVYDPDSDK